MRQVIHALRGHDDKVTGGRAGGARARMLSFVWDRPATDGALCGLASRAAGR